MKAKKRGRPRLRQIEIGIDAAVLGKQDKRVQVGVHTVALNLVKNLARLDKKNNYLLYSFSPIDPGFMQELGTRMRNVVLPRFGWFSVWLPLAIRIQKPDIFVALSQAMPKIQIPTVGFIYDLAFEQYPGAYKSVKKLRDNSYKIAQYAQSIITISKSSKSEIARHYSISEKQIAVAYPGVSSQFSPDGVKYIGKTPYFLFVGALKKTKNVPFLIDSFAQFLKVAPEEYQLLLVGSDFWLDKDIKEAIQKNSIEGSVIVKGYVEEKDLPKYYRGASGFISLSHYEGFNLPIVEAMACGASVIASQIPTHIEVVGDAGILVDISKQEAVIDAMILLSQDAATREKFSAKSIRQASKFSWRAFAQSVLSEIKNEKLQ